jgi:predicted transposase YdaD
VGENEKDMHEYDVVLKALLQGEANSVLKQISGTRVARWLPVELPKVENPRMDLLGETAKGKLLHIELQSTNDPAMAIRMAKYMLRVREQYDRFPKQFLLYVGEAKMKMPRSLKSPDLTFRYQQVDIRRLDAERLLASPWVSDNVIAILAKLKDRREAVRRMLRRISQLSGDTRSVAFQQLSILAGLRRLGADVQEEAKQMPILSDIMDHDIIGPAIRQGLEQGLQQGMEQGLRQGLQQGMERGMERGMRKVVRQQIEKRFGTLSTPYEQRFVALSEPELEALGLRVIDAHSLDELFSGS